MAQKLAEVEASLGRAVRFGADPSLAGYAAARTKKPQGRVFLRPDCVEDLSTIGEEIMHLHRMAERYPVIKPLQRAANDGYADVLNALTGFFEEHAFFPFLEELGLDPRRSVGQTVRDSLGMLPQLLPRIARWQEPMRRVKLSALFVQTDLMAPDSEHRTELLRAFERPLLDAGREVGSSLCDQIRAARDDPPQDVEARMERCVERLRLPGDAAVVVVEPFQPG